MTSVPEVSATRQLPELPLPSEAKRSKLLELLVQQRKDALRGLRFLRRAFLVQHVHLAAAGGAAAFLRHLHAVLLGLDAGGAAEQAAEEALVLLLHLGLGIGVTHEVQALLPVAILDREADAVQRQPDAAPGAIERLV